MQLRKALPFAAMGVVIAGFASMGMPGFSGFIAEIQVLIGAWHGFSAYAVLAGIGVVIGVAYTLRAVQKAFYPDRTEMSRADLKALEVEPITLQKKVGAVVLIGCTLVIGLFPRVLLD